MASTPPESDQPESDHPSLHGQESTGLWRHQTKVKSFYVDSRVQIFVAALITTNFLCQCVQKQVDPTGADYKNMWMVIDNSFNVMFCIELGINMYGSFWWPFWREAWNIFDVIVVLIGLCDLTFSLASMEWPNALKLLRMFRAFRVFRLFNRIASLRKIVKSLMRALPGVGHAFLINLLVMLIYSVLAVENFSHVYADCPSGELDKEGVTARGICYGLDYYGNTLLSVYTMFQVLTGESWSEAVVRPALQYFDGSVINTFGVSFFFVTFILLNGFVLINVVVAVLLDGMNSTPPAEYKEEPGVPEMTPAEALAFLHTDVATLRDDVAGLRSELGGVTEDLASMVSEINRQIAETLAVAERARTANTLGVPDGVVVNFPSHGLPATARPPPHVGFQPLSVQISDPPVSSER